MPTPSGLKTTPLHGRYVEPNAIETPLQGTITFTPNPSPILFPNENLIVAGTETAELDANGEFTIELVSTLGDGNPPEWVYSVVEKIIGQRQRTYMIALPYTNGEVVELADVQPTASAPQYIPVVGPVGAPGIVTSVNGYSLASVYLDAADVGAIDLTEKGTASGVATLDDQAKVPIAQIPDLSTSYVSVTRIGQANGVAGLDPNALVPASQLGLANTAPPSIGVGAVGTSSLLARQDHTHDGVDRVSDQTISGKKTFIGGPVFAMVAPQLTGDTSGTTALRFNVSGELVDRFQVRSDGSLEWGDGVNPRSTKLEWLSEGVLQATGQITVTEVAPTSNAHLTRKDYVDSLVAARTGVVTLDTSQVITGFKTLEGASDTTGVLQARSNGDAEARFYLRADGRMAWGTGTIPQDTFLYRDGIGVLGLDDTAIRGYRATPGDVTYVTRVPTDTENRFQLAIDGSMAWGTGTTVQDVRLFRDAAGILKTDGIFRTVGQLQALGGLSVTGAASVSGTLNIGVDVNLYRSTANTLKTDDSFVVVGSITASGGKLVLTQGDWVVPTSVDWYVTPNNTAYQGLRVQSDGSRAYFDGSASTKTAFSSGSQNAFTIPVGYRPLKNHYFSLPRATSGAPPTLGAVVQSDGTVVVYTSSSVSLSDTWDFSSLSWPLN